MNERFLNQLVHGDCYEIMPMIEDKSIDLVLTDPPYNMTNCSWEFNIDIESLFFQYKRIIKDNGTIVMFGNNPFTSEVIYKNRDIFRYSCVWVKPNSTTPHLAKIQPMRRYEDIMVFYKKKNVYNPIKTKGKPYKWNSKRSGGVASNIKYEKDNEIINLGERLPTNVFEFAQERGLHPTQKPVKLLEHIIKMYTNEGMTVLDTFSGSGSTAIACLNTSRNFICIEKDDDIYECSVNRLRKAAQI